MFKNFKKKWFLKHKTSLFCVKFNYFKRKNTGFDMDVIFVKIHSISPYLHP